MSNMKKRFFAILMTLVMALSLSVSAFAAEPSDVITGQPISAASQEASTRSAGDVIAFGAGTITGGIGTIDVYLSKGNFFADIVAGIGYAQQNGTVLCSVTTPDGDNISLGNISGSGARTDYYEILYAPAGTYKFHFASAMTSSIEVVAYIYD